MVAYSLLAISLLATFSVSTAFCWAPSCANRVYTRSVLNMKVALFYGTSTGNTENVASYIDDLSPEIELVAYIDDFRDVDAYDGL